MAGLISCILLTGCDPQNISIPTDSLPPLGKRQTISFALQKWNHEQPIRLQKHQLIPIDYLEKNPSIKGLIINHYLGTGKTFLSIGFAERNPNRPVIILAPGFLHSHWLDQLDKYGVKDKTRYRFISHAEPEALLKTDTSNAIVILDESHRFIEHIRTHAINSEQYSRAYFKMRQAHRILSLTGTPIYNDTFDLIYQINLVSGKNIFPFNLEQARLTFSKINKLNAFWRGHVLESLYIPDLPGRVLFPIIVSYLRLDQLLYTLPAPYGELSLISLFSLCAFWPAFVKLATPLHQYPLREFDPHKLKATITQYISYYDFYRDTRFYPTQLLHEKELNYNDAQLTFLYKFYDSQLEYNEILQLLKDKKQSGLNPTQKEHLELNQTLIQTIHQKMMGAGREIGNLLFIEKHDKSKKIMFPEKFHQILSTIKHSDGPIVLYSHYYYNGLLLFKQFLDASGYKNQYKIFHPQMPKEQLTQIIQDFNANKTKILLLHPDITEGISLKGTRQLHFLEVPINSALQQQIIGRAIRYRSHDHLPKNKRHVDVYIWKYVLAFHDIKTYTALRKNWHYNFSELNFYSGLGEGRFQADPNAIHKSTSPDMLAYQHLHSIKRSIEIFKQYTKVFAIENVIY
jgi:hypothetical protein